MILSNIHLFSVITPMIMGFLSFLIRDRYKKIFDILYLAIFISIFIFVIYSCFALNLFKGKEYLLVIGGWSKAMGIELKYNIYSALSVIFLFLITVSFFITNLGEKISYAIRGFVCIMLCGANGMIITNDIFNSYVFFEIVCITTYIMYAHTNNAVGLKNAYNYMILSGFSGVIFLFVAGILYQITGNLNLDLIHNSLIGIEKNTTISAVFVLFILVMMFKIGTYPLHNIMFGVYENLQINYLMIVACVSSIVYPFFILKFILSLFSDVVLLNNEYLCILLKLFGGIGFLFFNIIALSSTTAIKFIISLSFAQTSLFMFNIPYLHNKISANGILFSILSLTALKSCLFGALYKIQKMIKIQEIKKVDMCFISSNTIKYVFCLLLFLTAGMPFSMVFLSKWYIISGILNSPDNILWIAIVIIGFTIDIYACFAFIRSILSRSINDDRIFEVKLLSIITQIIFSIFVVIFLVVISFFLFHLK